MEGFREQRSNSGNSQRDNLLNSLHECDAYKKLKKSSKYYDMHNFYSRFETSFNHLVPKINEVTDLLIEKYDEAIDKALLAYGIDREFILMHMNDIRMFSFGPSEPFQRVECILYNRQAGLEISLFKVNREFYFHGNDTTTLSVEGRITLQMNYEGSELEEVKKAIKEAYNKEKET